MHHLKHPFHPLLLVTGNKRQFLAAVKRESPRLFRGEGYGFGIAIIAVSNSIPVSITSRCPISASANDSYLLTGGAKPAVGANLVFARILLFIVPILLFMVFIGISLNLGEHKVRPYDGVISKTESPYPLPADM